MKQAKAEPKLKREGNVSWLNLLDELANKPAEEEKEPEESAPDSRDPRMNHRSKIVQGLPQDLSEADLEAERQRLRESYLYRRAATVCYEKQYGCEPPQLNYNEFC